jgi:hypothetical protein
MSWKKRVGSFAASTNHAAADRRRSISSHANGALDAWLLAILRRIHFDAHQKILIDRVGHGGV